MKHFPRPDGVDAGLAVGGIVVEGAGRTPQM